MRRAALLRKQAKDQRASSRWINIIKSDAHNMLQKWLKKPCWGFPTMSSEWNNFYPSLRPPNQREKTKQKANKHTNNPKIDKTTPLNQALTIFSRNGWGNPGHAGVSDWQKTGRACFSSFEILAFCSHCRLKSNNLCCFPPGCPEQGAVFNLCMLFTALLLCRRQVSETSCPGVSEYTWDKYAWVWYEEAYCGLRVFSQHS